MQSYIVTQSHWFGCHNAFSHPPPFSLILSIISSKDTIFSLGFLCWLAPDCCSSSSINFQSENEVGKIPVQRK